MSEARRVNVVTNASVRDIRFNICIVTGGRSQLPISELFNFIRILQGLQVQGHGLTFTEGRGTEVVVSAYKPSYLYWWESLW